jgi:hypothetical protein
MANTTNYFVWMQLINTISLSNSRCDIKTTKDIIQGILDDMNGIENPNPFFKCKIEQMLFLHKTLSFLDETNKDPLKTGINELCEMCQQHIKEQTNKN